jgi:hypothetical protein
VPLLDSRPSGHAGARRRPPSSAGTRDTCQRQIWSCVRRCRLLSSALPWNMHEPYQGHGNTWAVTLAATDLQVLGVRLGVVLRWREPAPDAASAAARDGASAEALADVGAREVAGPLEAQAMLCAEGACGGPGPALSPRPPAACADAGPVPGARTSAPPEAAAPGGGEAEPPPAPGAGAGAAAAGRAPQEATGVPWALYAVLGPARAHLSGAEVAAAAAVAGGASAEAARRLAAALPARAWPAGSPGARRALGERGDAGGAGACEQAWLAEVAVETSMLTLAFAPGGAAAAAASVPPPPGLSCSPAAAACLGCRGSASLLVASEVLAVAAAAARTPGRSGDGAAVLAASLAQPGLWVGPGGTGAAAAAADLGVCSLPPLDAWGAPDQRAPLAAACAAPAPESRAAPPNELARPSAGVEDQASAGGARAEGLAPIRTGSGRGGAHAQPSCESPGWEMPAAPRLLVAGARALVQGPCAPALLASPVCLLSEAARSAGVGGGGTGAGASAARLSLSVGSVSGLLDAAHLRALVRALMQLCPNAHGHACECSARGARPARRLLGLAGRCTPECESSGCRLHRPQRTRQLKAQSASGMLHERSKLCFTVTESGTTSAAHASRFTQSQERGAWRRRPRWRQPRARAPRCRRCRLSRRPRCRSRRRCASRSASPACRARWRRGGNQARDPCLGARRRPPQSASQIRRRGRAWSQIRRRARAWSQAAWPSGRWARRWSASYARHGRAPGAHVLIHGHAQTRLRGTSAPARALA